MRSISDLLSVRAVLILLILACSLTNCVFALAGPPEVVLHTFNSYADGITPESSLIQDSDGNLYGTTVGGGAIGYGTVFKITNSGTLTTLHSFIGPDGYSPVAGVIQGKHGNLYGTTYAGGANGFATGGDGTVFEISIDGTTFKTLYSFSGADGYSPTAGLIQGRDGNLYGTTEKGGANNGYGTVFEISTDGTTFKTLHSFNGADGGSPVAGMIQGNDGNLYGTTEGGGANGDGVVFKISTSGTTFKTLYSFNNTYGYSPNPNGVIQGKDGNLYGTSVFGGGNNEGLVFKISTTGTTFTILHSFNGTDGSYPDTGMIQGSDGNLFGITGANYVGSTYNAGTVFQISANGKTFKTLHSFDGTDGANPVAAMIQGSNGNLYGTTYQGGANGNYGGNGTVYEVSRNGSNFNTLYNFAGSPTDGANPYSNLIEGPDGNLYGTTSIGGIQSQPNLNVQGTIFQLQTQLPLIPPIILSFSPAKVKVGATVTVIGFNLANTTSVTINGVAQTITSDTAKSLKFKATSGTKSGLIVVTTSKGAGSSLTDLVID